MAEIKAAIAFHQTKIFDSARQAGLRDRFEAYAADALVEMARASMGHTNPDMAPKRVATKIIIRIDHTALARGHVEPGEVCDIPATGPVPVTLTQPMLGSGELEQPGRVGAQRVTSAGPTAQSELASGPAAPAGGRTREAQTRNTPFDQLDGNGKPHHALKTRQNYQLVPGTGRRPMHPPASTDPP